MDTEDVRKTAFVVHNGTYEFLKMPFGLVNFAAALVRGLRKLLEGLELRTTTWMTSSFTRLRGENMLPLSGEF